MTPRRLNPSVICAPMPSATVSGLEAANTLFATRGFDVSVDEIAQLAQVGVGTLYRNFPTKGALLEALFAARIAPLSASRGRRLQSEDPGEAFVSFVRRMSDEFADFKALATRWPSSASTSMSREREISGELMAAVGALFERAQQAGRVRPDVTMATSPR